MPGVINGTHILIYSSDAEKDRAFFRDVLNSPHVDAGHGWLIFALPPAEVAVHPADNPAEAGHGMMGAHVYLMCDDLDATMRWLATKGVKCSNVSEERWGLRTAIRLPSGGELGLYQPRHEKAIGL